MILVSWTCVSLSSFKRVFSQPDLHFSRMIFTPLLSLCFKMPARNFKIAGGSGFVDPLTVGTPTTGRLRRSCTRTGISAPAKSGSASPIWPLQSRSSRPTAAADGEPSPHFKPAFFWAGMHPLELPSQSGHNARHWRVQMCVFVCVYAGVRSCVHISKLEVILCFLICCVFFCHLQV